MNFIKKHWPIIFLIFVELILFFTNYKHGTFLVGWDNLYPEFNFGLNIKRDFFAIWQQYRGLGLIDGMSHAANLPHDFERLILSFIFPLNLIRWVYIFLTHLLGGIGMYVLLKLILSSGRRSASTTINNIFPFFGALFYQYNLGTIQQFFLPFEVFVVHFATLPWLIYFSLQYLDKGGRKYLFYFFISSLLTTPQAHVPTVFIVFSFAIFLIFLTKLFLSKFKNYKRIILLTVVIIAVNAFWGLPFAYSTLTNSKVIANSKNFQMATNDIFYRNNKFGDFADVALIKGIVLDYKHYDYKSDQYTFMMQPWLDYQKNFFYSFSAWSFFILTLFGLFVSLRNRKYLPFAVLFIFSFFMMSTDTPVIGNISSFLRNHFSLFRIIFRFVFTKFSILYAFSYSILLCIGIYTLFLRLRFKLKFFIVFFIFLLLYTLPAFQGNFFYKNLAVKIPEEYFQTFDFFQKQDPDTRIVSLPIPWYWAWIQPKWGTVGSGFIWYGIPQPITDLAFTPWSDKNENFHWELDQAIYANDPELLANVLKKYDITWIYLDENISLNQARKFTYDQYENLLNKTSGVNLTQQYNLIKIYKYEETKKLNNFVSFKNVQNIGPSYKYDSYDVAYINQGNYMTSNQDYDYYYPFRSLFSGKNPSDQEFNIEENNQEIIFKSILPQSWSDITINSPLMLKEETGIAEPQISIEERYLKVKLKKNDIFIYDTNTDEKYLRQENNACDKNKKGLSSLEKIDEKNQTIFKFTSQSSHNCIELELTNFPHIYGYLFNIKTSTDQKRGLFINFFDKTIKKSDLETYLDNDGKTHNYYVVLPPKQNDGNGYTLYTDNISEGREKVTNTLINVKAYKIPYYSLKNINIVNNKTNVTKQNTIIYLSQSFNPGWKAYEINIKNQRLKIKNIFINYFPFLFGKELKSHVLVNNWANGWLLQPTNLDGQGTALSLQNIVIVFWPQYLEYLGFALLFISFVFILLPSRKKRHMI